jgi:hypothetical protein
VDYWATPERGLRVTLDGAIQDARDTFTLPITGYTKHGPAVSYVPTDIGFAVTPGVHRIEVDAPGCKPLTEDIDVPAFVPLFVSGRLPPEDDTLRGPTGAPNGIGLLYGGYVTTRGPHAGSDSFFHSAYQYDATTSEGFWLGTSSEHRNFAFAFDTMMGYSSTSGTAMSTMNGGTSAFTNSGLNMGMEARVGARLPLGSTVVAAGTGIGGDLWFFNSTLKDKSIEFLAKPDGGDASWYVPLWTAVTFKSSCDWGAQLLASYEVHPGAFNEDGPAVAAGLVWQPSDACSQPVGLVVR